MPINNHSTKVVTGIVRLSYANVWEPKSINGGKEKYSVSLIIPKSDKKTIDAINKAVDAAIEDGISKFGGKKPNKAAIKLPLRDGDIERDDEAYKDSFFVNANSTTPPQIVDAHVQPILDRSEVYSGCYARVSVTFYETRAWPVVLEISRRSETASLWVLTAAQLMISPTSPTTTAMMIFLANSRKATI